jgi:hypothetical protein
MTVATDAPLTEGHCQVCNQKFKLDEIGRIPWHKENEHARGKCLGSLIAPLEKKV